MPDLVADPVFYWWACLCAAAVFNVAAWGWAYGRLTHDRPNMPAGVFASRRCLAWLSAAYVAGCAFRSFLPMVDAPRICAGELADLELARIGVGRSVATVAELCFAAQWAWLLREAAAVTGSREARWTAWGLLPVIVLAELSSWYAVLTTNYLWHLVENALWTLAAIAALLAFADLRPRLDGAARRWLMALGLGAAAYIAFMLAVDLPMYYQRWQADALAGSTYLSLAEGMAQVLERCRVTHEWAAWRLDVTWLTLYFTLAVWSSIALMHFPAFAPRAARRRLA